MKSQTAAAFVGFNRPQKGRCAGGPIGRGARQDRDAIWLCLFRRRSPIRNPD